MVTSTIERPKIVSPAEWLLRELLAREKQLTRQRDELSRHRRELPWVKVGENYVFDGPNGKETLGDLFGGRTQRFCHMSCWVPGRRRAVWVARSALTTSIAPLCTLSITIFVCNDLASALGGD